ncbi:acyltransferase family protein [Streptomyces mexicanus]|jgi:fucose 4-O-acetylase-like acetyltransferase|uniref:acyltransferase family protein n=1 Tax=Streptomyces mexicanus TaxID=178566 RepID=UPI0031EE8386
MFHAAPSPGPKRTPLPPSPSPASDAPDPQRPDERRGRTGEQRDPFFDNAKYLAIVLVALGHSWATIKSDNRFLETAYNVVYVFHMPAFVIISGYFSRNFDLRPQRLKRLLTGVLVPYVVFQTAYSLFRIHVGHTGDRHVDLFTPWYLTWFLCALFIWRLTAPVWRMLRRPLPVAVGLAMLASVTPGLGGVLELQRVLQFLPCFVLGMCLKPEHFRLVRRRSARILSVPVIVLAVALGWWSVPRMDAGWLYRNAAAQDLGAPWWAGPVTVLLLFGCALLLTACFLAWVPGRRLWCTALGAGTLGGYLLHGFAVKGVLYAGGFEADWLHGPLGALVVTVVAAAGMTVLCTRPVRQTFRCVMEPRMDWAFRRIAPQASGERERTDGRAAGAVATPVAEQAAEPEAALAR